MIPTLENKTLSVALLVGIAHIVCGITVLVSPSALLVASFASLGVIAGHIAGTGFAAFLLLASGVLAVVGSSSTWLLHHRVHPALFLPQQILLVSQIWSLSDALLSGQYPDGYDPIGGAWFVLTDQIWAWLFAVSHTIWLAAYVWGGRYGARR